MRLINPFRPVLCKGGARRGSRVLLAAAVPAVVCAATACTATPGAAGSEASTAAARTASATASATPAAVGTSGGGTGAGGTPGAPASPPPSPSPSPKPKPKPKPKPSVKIRTLRMADGSKITVAVFRGPVTYVLHNGATDPGALAAEKGVKAGPAVGHRERRRLLAAFNGGFKLAAVAGGYEQEGKVISPLLKGYASLIIDRSGRAHIADWGYGAPAKGERVYSVRQNLRPLVSHGKPAATAASWGDWGGTVGGLEYVARSAVGQDAAGHLIYVASMSTVPADLAAALVRMGARIGMELDINPNWVQFDVAARPGGPLRAGLPGQWRPAGQFLAGWDRDFFTVLG